jgi:NAD(P)-dependent dehydrogenase (short-subunit alcohol dehydrogenase family)
MRFAGKTLFATGAASGIGFATARRFAAEGGRVAIVDIDGDKAATAAHAVPGAIGIACDVADEASVRAAVAEAVERFGAFSCVLNSAGHASFGRLADLALADWNRMLAVHATGTFLVCREALPVLRGAGGGAIVNVASIAALVGRDGVAGYSAAKGAILALSRQLAIEAAADGIRVNVVAPGHVRTGMTEPLFVARGDGDYAKGAAGSVEHTPQKRSAEPEEIAAPICFLLSEEASFFTGTLLVPDGGATAL